MRPALKRTVRAAMVAAGLGLGLAACVPIVAPPSTPPPPPRVVATSCASSTSANVTVEFGVPAKYFPYSSRAGAAVSSQALTPGAAEPIAGVVVQGTNPPTDATGRATLTGMTPEASYRAEAFVMVAGPPPLHFKLESLGLTNSFTIPTCTLPGGLVQLTINDTPHTVGYDRAAEFGGWIDADHDCQDTRAEVLIQESTIAPTFSTAKQCSVTAGNWIDPWSGTVTTVAGALDIDHMVPLGNAWASGAWTWTQTQRVAYANDLAEPEHLHAILASENRSKGDRGPEGWRPPSPATWCQYAREWDTIKNRWQLTATTAEWKELLVMAASC